MTHSPKAALLDELWRNHASWIKRYVTRRGIGPELAEEVVSDVWVRVIRHVNKHGDTGQGHVRGWLAAIARNIIADHFRAKRPTTVPIDAAYSLRDCSLHADPVALAEADAGLRLVEAALAELPADEAAAVRRVVINGEAQNVVCHQLQVTQSAVSKRVRRGLDRLGQNPALLAWVSPAPAQVSR